MRDAQALPMSGGICLSRVTKVYDLAAGRRLRLPVPGHRRVPVRPLVALDGVDLEVAPGEVVGIIGPNGAGKSTLLKLIAGVTRPTSGHVTIGGRVAAMIELGIGFDPRRSGRENLACTSALLGLSRSESKRRAPSMVEFSGIADHLDAPLRTYSTGMKARLGFAVATHVDADILAVDEALSVGDAAFQLKCRQRIADVAKAGTTVVVVAHDMSLIAAMCSRAVLLRSGRITDDGAAIDVIERYLLRAPDRQRLAERSSMYFMASRLDGDCISVGDGIEIDAEVMVERPHDGAPLLASIEFTVPSRDPSVVSGSATSAVPELRDPGLYRLRGSTSAIVAANSSYRVATSLVDVDRGEVVARVVSDLRVKPADSSLFNHLVLAPQWSIERIEPPMLGDRRRPRPGPGGEPAVIRLAAVTKRFSGDGRMSVARSAIPGRIGRPRISEVSALAGVSLDVARATSLGIIGPNGAGKSTLLRILAGVSAPDSGSVETVGRIVPMLELGLGFHPDMNGADNVRTSARLLGIRPRQIPSVLAKVVEFSGLGSMMDVPVKRYSTGMRARLGFALAINAGADILLIDEVLAVGDEDFRRRAIDAIRALRDEGVTIVFVSHQLRLVRQLCDRVVHLERGRVIDDDETTAVIGRYAGSAGLTGERDASLSIRIHRFQLQHHRVPMGGAIEFDGVVEVAEASPGARLDLSLRIPPANRDAMMSRDETNMRTSYRGTLEKAGAGFCRRGWYRFSGSVDCIGFVGEFDVVLSIVDEENDVALGDCVQTVMIGDPTPTGFPQLSFSVSWTVERLADPEPPSTSDGR